MIVLLSVCLGGCGGPDAGARGSTVLSPVIVSPAVSSGLGADASSTASVNTPPVLTPNTLPVLSGLAAVGGSSTEKLPLSSGVLGSVTAKCAAGYAPGGIVNQEENAAPKPTHNGWDERFRYKKISLDGSKLVFCQGFDKPVDLGKGPLYAKNRTDFGVAPFDEAGGQAYSFVEGALRVASYRDASGKWRAGLVQTASKAQAYAGSPVENGVDGFMCKGCYWEFKQKLDPTTVGGWAGAWLLSPEIPGSPGHLELDVNEYYGKGAATHLAQATHTWPGPTNNRSNYMKILELADGQYHTFGADLRGIAKVDGAPAIVMYLDGQELARLPVDEAEGWFSKPFYALFNHALRTEKEATDNQATYLSYIAAWK